MAEGGIVEPMSLKDKLMGMVKGLSPEKASKDLIDSRRAILEKLTGKPLAADDMMSKVTEEDAKNINPGTPRNWLVNKMGLPETWKQSVADEKTNYQNMPEELGSAIGSISSKFAKPFGSVKTIDTVKVAVRGTPIEKAKNLATGLKDKADDFIKRVEAQGGAKNAAETMIYNKLTNKQAVVLSEADKVAQQFKDAAKLKEAQKAKDIIKKMEPETESLKFMGVPVGKTGSKKVIKT